MIEQKFGIEIKPMWRETNGANAQVYLAAVRAELAKVIRSEAGRGIAAALRHHNKGVLLMPYEGEDCNAQEDAVNPKSKVSVILYSPELLKRSGCDIGKAGANGATLPHEILFHELVHSLRRISGNNDPRALKDGLAAYRNSEEFLAILATNIFISDKSNPEKSELRGTGYGHSLLEKEYSESYQFFRQGMRVFHLVAKFCDENKGFTGMLARVEAPFNPIHAYYSNRRKAFEAAVSGDVDRTFQSVFPEHFYQDTPGGQFYRPGRLTDPNALKRPND
jgi:hypothetical protein